jgi:hypothetical protein
MEAAMPAASTGLPSITRTASCALRVSRESARSITVSPIFTRPLCG